MIQLVAYTQGAETPTELDLAAGSDVKLNYKFADPGKPLTRQSPHSQAFTLPFTAENNKFFGHWYNVNLSSGSFDSNVKTRAEIRNSGTIITEGFLQLRGVSLKAETYQVNVVGAAGELFSKLGDATLKDILASLTTGGAEDYEYAPTETNVINSWTLANDITAGSVGAGVVAVPLADYGNTPGGRLFWDYGVEDGLKLPNYLRGWHLKPSMQIKHIVEKLFVYAGFELSSSFLTSAPMDALYMLLGTSSKQALTRPFYGSKVGLTSDITVPGETTDDDPASFVQLTGWTDTGGDFYDPDNHMDSLGFTAPVDMEAAFEISLCFDNFTQNSWGYFYAIKNGETIAETVFNTIDQPDATTAWQWSFNVSLLAGENMSVYVQAVNSTPIEINNSLSTAWNKGTYLRFISYAATSGGEFIAVLDGLPQLKASDFLKELVNRFNLAVVADAEDDQTIIIEPMNNYIGTGTERDWTGKVDLDSNQQLTPMTQFRSKTNHFTDGVDKDYLNQWHSENFSMALGDYGFDSQDEFAQGDMTTPMLCGSTGMYPITTSNVSTNVQLNNITIPTYYGTNDAGESDIVTFKPKLLFYNELATLVNQSYYLGETLATTYPHFSPFTSKEIGASTWSVYWRHTFSFSTAVIGTEFAQGVYDRFWAQYMTDIYDPEARLLECDIVLSANDVRTLKFADIIRIKNEMYRVLDIGGYSPAQTSKTSVRLLKTLTNVKLLRPGNNDCELTYVSSNVDGTTNWQDASGAAASPTAICCDSVGLYFSDSICWVQFPDTGGGGTKHDDNSAVPDYMPPVIIPGTTSPIKIPVPNTTDKLIANKSTALFPYANGQPTKQTSNTTGYALGAHQRYLMCATTSGLTTEVASPRGVLNSSGDGQPMMMIRTNMTTQIRVRCLGVDVASSDDTGISEYAFLEKLFIVQGSRARATELDSQTLDASKSAGRASPTVTISSTDTTDITGGLTAVNVNITGGEADRITSWMIDVDMTLIDKSGTSTLRDAILCENGAQVLTENKAQLVTES